MSELEKAARQALEALNDRASLMKWQTARDAIRQALEQPAQDGGACPTCGAWHDDQIIKQPAQQEPVAKPRCKVAGFPYPGQVCGKITVGREFCGATPGTCQFQDDTRPQAREPLTDEQIVDAVREAGLDWHQGWTLDEDEPNRFIQFARALEAAHGIKGEK